MLVSAIAVSGERNLDAPVVSWFFITMLAFMALVDSALHVIELDAVNEGRKLGTELSWREVCSVRPQGRRRPEVAAQAGFGCPSDQSLV
jgi:hypothetical protein